MSDTPSQIMSARRKKAGDGCLEAQVAADGGSGERARMVTYKGTPPLHLPTQGRCQLQEEAVVTAPRPWQGAVGMTLEASGVGIFILEGRI